MTGQLDEGDRTSEDTLANFDRMPKSTVVLRSAFGGVLMGLANLVPGISGGTMLLAVGIYPQFIDAVAEVTRLRFKFRSLLVLMCVVVAAALGILFFAGTLKTLVVTQRWVMYSLFTGLTLGGIPVVWSLARRASRGLVVCAFISFAAMVILAWLQKHGVVATGNSNYVTLFLAGLAGASAMILPGVSGGYLLLLIGQYLPILSAIADFKDALMNKDMAAVMNPAISVMLPVGMGVLAGVAVVGNLLHWFLLRCRQATLGALLGLLIGSTVGLFPFQAGVAPKPGEWLKGREVTEDNLATFDEEDWRTEYFQPSLADMACSMLLIGLGFGLTIGIAQIGRKED